jgi:hypothetical protein
MASPGGGDGSGSRAPSARHLPSRSGKPSVNSTLEGPTMSRTQELDIIHWWEYVGIKYPTLRKIT